MEGKLILNLILILILIFINGFFAASEIAIISLDKDKLHLLALKNKALSQQMVDFDEK